MQLQLAGRVVGVAVMAMVKNIGVTPQFDLKNRLDLDVIISNVDHWTSIVQILYK